MVFLSCTLNGSLCVPVCTLIRFEISHRYGQAEATSEHRQRNLWGELDDAGPSADGSAVGDGERSASGPSGQPADAVSVLDLLLEIKVHAAALRAR